MLPENILFSNSPADDLQNFLNKKQYSMIVALVDENTADHCLPLFDGLFLNVIQVPSGEEYKTIATCEIIWGKMTDLNLDRHAVMIVLGGGVLGDMGGFCAATFKRGIDFVLVPTTLLAQADASIGGKLGVDFRSFKNHIGVFQQPALTLLCTCFLNTLPERELRSGFAEIIKHCLISDAQMWKQISIRALHDQDWKTLLKHSVEFKAMVTSEDPREKGLRKVLNAGHTIGHALESYLLANDMRILHGEAIAIGLIAESFIAERKRMISGENLNDIVRFILSIFGKVDLSVDQINGAAEYASQDKKNKDNKILCVLPDGIGKARWDIEIGISDVTSGLTFYNELQM